MIAQSISNLESENQSELSILQNQKFWLPFSAAACVNMLSFGTTVPFGRTRLSRGSTADVALVHIVIAVQHTNIKAEMRFLSLKKNSPWTPGGDLTKKTQNQGKIKRFYKNPPESMVAKAPINCETRVIQKVISLAPSFAPSCRNSLTCPTISITALSG